MCLEFSTLIFFALSFHTGIPVRSRREPFLYPTEFHGRDTSKYTFLKYFHGDVDWLARAERLLFVRFPTFIQRVLCVMYSLSNTDDNIIVNWVRMWRTRYRQVQLVWESLDAGIVRTIKYKKKNEIPQHPKHARLKMFFLVLQSSYEHSSLAHHVKAICPTCRLWNAQGSHAPPRQDRVVQNTCLNILLAGVCRSVLSRKQWPLVVYDVLSCSRSLKLYWR